MRSAAVDNFLYDMKEPYRSVMGALREIIFEKVKGVEEQLKWNCPFYSYKGLLCYINFDKKARKVALCFVEGFILEDNYGLLTRETKNIAKLFVDENKNLNVREINYYLKQAIKINKTKSKNFLNIRKQIK
ncbi:MAG TPA: DUF1801 domain-containing protein [Cyclobacteriaceae bacterium]|nr:DUF1801 domain-containing protein [Cyclobacteriaceae bacterium]